MLPIAVSMGDPEGVGPEIIAGLLTARPDARLILCGDLTAFRDVDRRVIDAALSAGTVTLTGEHLTAPVVSGAGNPVHAIATKSWIEAAHKAVATGNARAMLTAPINKAVLATGSDFDYPGHTEFLGALDGGKNRAVMMIAAEGVLRVVPATIHIPLADVSNQLDADLLRETVNTIDRDLHRYLGKRPKIAMAGLNPHAGEDGRIGVEEQDWLRDFAQSMRNVGYDITDPLPADTMFHARARAQYDVALCMYHDQALIPVKTLAFDSGVNVTLGLSFLRASPDHGTAYDIAGQGIASATSMIAAYDLLDKWTRDDR